MPLLWLLMHLTVPTPLPVPPAPATVDAVPADPQPGPLERGALPYLARLRGTTGTDARLAVIDQALAQLPQPTRFRGLVLCQRGEILAAAGRYAQAYDGFGECARLLPGDPRVSLALAHTAFADQRPAQAAQYLIQTAKLAPRYIETLDPQFVRDLDRQLGYEHDHTVRSALLDALASSGYGKDDPALFAELALSAMRNDIAAGDTAAALRLLPSVLTPGAGIAMLIDRRYEPIWSNVEAWAGDDLSVQRRTYLAQARSAYALDASFDHLDMLAGALAATGHRDEAIALLAPATASPAATDDDDRFEFAHLAVRRARFLFLEGRSDESVAEMRHAIAVGGDTPAMLNVPPNLAQRLVDIGRYADAIAVLDRYTPRADQVENAAAIGYYVAIRACALAGTGDMRAARSAYQQVVISYARNANALEIATGCVGTPDEQRALWRKRVESDTDRSDALEAIVLARHRIALGLPSASPAERMNRMLAKDPEVAALFAASARPLPASFEGALEGWNDPRARLRGIPAALLQPADQGDAAPVLR